MKLAIFIICTALAGCAASPYQLGTKALEAGNYQAAEAQLIAAVAAGDSAAWNNLGVLYDRTGRPIQATRAYQMGARYGHAMAKKNLVMKGLPVPPVDLKSGSSTDGIAAALRGFNEGRAVNRPTVAPAAQRTVFCDSKKGFGDTVNTVCY